jgi:serine phosphatase RsbU (regulator of sigma subunit)/anti-sigma regulatory factor (Ser/Thr protein kinase)
LRLPADERSPAAARALVRQVLAAGGHDDALDSALLLVSELSTNGVVHAGTAVDIDVLADEHGVTVTVSDQQSGPVGAGVGSGHSTGRPLPGESPAHSPIDEFSEIDPTALELAEHGRGLLLVDRLATAWGTSHHAGGKSVWFRLGPALEEDGFAAPEAATRPVIAPAAGDEVPASAWAWLVHVPEGLRDRLSMPALVSELLTRLCEVTGAATGTVYLDQGDERGRQQLAGYRSAELGPSVPRARGLTVPIPVARPWRASVVLHPPVDAEAGKYWPELVGLSAQRMAISIDAERLHTEERRRRGALAFLAEASELLANSLDFDLTVALVPQLAVPRLGQWCAVHVLSARGGLHLASVAHVDEEQLTALQHALGTDIEPDTAARLDEVATTGETSALVAPLEGVAVPLAARGRLLGTLSVGRQPDRMHSGEDIAVLEDLARRASLALDNAQAHAERNQIAQDLQRALLPPELPVVAGAEFGAEYVPASSGVEVGGDFYDVLALRRNRWLVSIGDVCGKGTQAAAVTGVVRDVMRALAAENRSLPRILASLNRTLLAAQTDRHATVAAALVTRRESPTGERLLDVTLCLAGHDRPVLLRADGTTASVGECGTAVGLLVEFEVTETRFSLAPGEALVFCTDGVTERRHGAEMYGTRRLRRVVRGLVGHTAVSMATRVREDAVAFSAEPPRDDIAVLVLRNPSER